MLRQKYNRLLQAKAGKVEGTQSPDRNATLHDTRLRQQVLGGTRTALRLDRSRTQDPRKIEEIFRENFRERFDVDSQRDIDPSEQQLTTQYKKLDVLEEAEGLTWGVMSAAKN
ncbi:hypothetical protein MTO96_029556 [Rhipicephalus appendiculatus]